MDALKIIKGFLEENNIECYAFSESFSRNELCSRLVIDKGSRRLHGYRKIICKVEDRILLIGLGGHYPFKIDLANPNSLNDLLDLINNLLDDPSKIY